MTDKATTQIAGPELGVTYVACGAPYLAMALVSGLTLRATNPQVPVCIVTNGAERPKIPWWDEAIGDTWRLVDQATSQNRLLKLDVWRHSPFAKTLYLDCDTMVLGSIGALDPLLDHFDILLVPGGWPNADATERVLGRSVNLGEVTDFNGGVFAFRQGPGAEDFFRAWREDFLDRGLGRDQPSLIDAVGLSRARLYPLCQEWNHGDYWSKSRAARRRIIVWHYKSRSLDSRIEEYLWMALNWFSRDPADARALEKYLDSRRRHARRNRAWFAKAILRRVGGALSARPAELVGPTRWRQLAG